MLNEQQVLFDIAFSNLKNKDLNGFFSKIIDLHNIMTCNCFLNSQKEDVLLQMLNLINEYPDSKQDITLNLSKGFIYLRNKNIEKAYSYLLDVISLEKTNDLALSLLSSIDINPNCLSHSKLAVKLNPTARNYFLLASNYDYKSKRQNDIESNFKNGIVNYKKALKLNSNFACAHYGLGFLYKDRKNYDLAIEEFKSCIQLNPNHWAYGTLCDCLRDIKKYGEALALANKGFQINPEDKKYLLKFGFYYREFCYYLTSLNFYKKYLELFPDIVFTQKKIQSGEEIISNILNIILEKNNIPRKSPYKYIESKETNPISLKKKKRR